MGAFKIVIGLAGGLLACAVIHAPAADNPYQAIVARNVFGLKDPPPPPSDTPPANPPPKILLQGIATVLNKKQVLFKVTLPPKPGQNTGELSLILGVGEAQEEIEVLEIVEATGTVKFNNHGTIETKTFDKDSAKPAAASLPVPGMTPLPAGNNITAPSITVPRAGLPTPGLQSIPTRSPKPPTGVDSPVPRPQF